MDGIKESVSQKITSLPPLPESIGKIEKICRDPNAGINQLVTVVKQDPLLTANLLKVANSAYFGFASKVTSTTQAISLFGMSMVWGFAIEAATKQCFPMNVKAYGLTSGQFADIARLESALMWHWFARLDQKMAEVLIPASFISRIGMVIIATQLEELGLSQKFYDEIKIAQNSLENIERKFIGNSNQEISSALFAQWNFDKTIVAAIKASESPERATPVIRPYAHALQTVHHGITNNAEITKESAKNALKIARNAGFDQDPLISAIEKLAKITGPGISFLQKEI